MHYNTGQRDHRTRLPLVALVFLAASAAIALAACSDSGGSDDSGGVGDTPTPTVALGGGATSLPPVSAMGPGISVTDALASSLDGPLLVNGFVLAKGGDVRLCEGLLESFPSQCGSPSIPVDGLDLSGLVLTEASGVRWTAQSVQLLGELSDGVFTILSNVSASGASMP